MWHYVVGATTALQETVDYFSYSHVPDWRALMLGMLANPEDQLRRLIAADWLEEAYNRPEEAYRFRMTLMGGESSCKRTLASEGVPRHGCYTKLITSHNYWYGGACHYCKPNVLFCQECNSTGRTPEHGKIIAWAHPITILEIDDTRIGLTQLSCWVVSMLAA